MLRVWVKAENESLLWRTVRGLTNLEALDFKANIRRKYPNSDFHFEYKGV